MLKKVKILIGILIIFILILLLMWNFNIRIPCIFYELSGLYCPGCGMTRATLSLLQLDFYQAIRFNIFSIIVIPFIAFYTIVEIYSYIANKSNFIDKKIPAIIWVIFIGLLLLYGVLRNIPQFSYLAPTII